MMITHKDTQKTPKGNTIKVSLIIIIILISALTIEGLLRDQLSSLSNHLLSYIQRDRETDNWLFSTGFYLKLLGHRYIFYGIIIVIFNRENIFKPFCLLNLIFNCEMLSSFFKLLYALPHPYSQSSKDTPLIQNFPSNQRSFAFPSKALLIAPVFYFSMLRMFVSDKAELFRRRVIGTIMICLLIFLIALGEFVLGFSSLSHIAFSIIFSALIYSSMYYLLLINYHNASRLFYSLLKIPLKKIIGINVFLLVAMLLLYCFGSFKAHEELEAKEAFCSFFIFLGNIPFILSLKLELAHYFKDSYNNWSQYNFDPQGEKQIMGNTLIEKISISKGVQWNKTNISKYFGRLLILLAFALICVAISNIGDIEASAGWFVISVKILLPLALLTYTLGYSFKVIALKCGLCNTNMFTMIRESI